MFNMNYRAHLGVYWRTQRILLLIFFTVLIVNISLQSFITRIVMGSDVTFNISAILPTVVGVLIGMLFAIPITEVTAIPYLLTLGSRRKDILFSAVLNNILCAGFVTVSLSALLGIYILTKENLPPIYMGTILDSWNSLIFIGLFNLLFFFSLTSVIYFIGIIFHRWGLLRGLGVLFLVLSFPAWLIKEYYEFFIWGGSFSKFLLGMFIIGILFILLSKMVLSRIEIRHYRSRFQLTSFIFLVCMLIIFSASVYWGTERLIDTSTISSSGRFAYTEQGVNEKSFHSQGDQELHLSWRSFVAEGDLVLTLKSPSEETVYTAEGNSNELVTIPLTEKGKWTFSVTYNKATDGRYSLRGLIKN